jgi:hypothetical protein
VDPLRSLVHGGVDTRAGRRHQQPAQPDACPKIRILVTLARLRHHADFLEIQPREMVYRATP